MRVHKDDAIMLKITHNARAVGEYITQPRALLCHLVAPCIKTCELAKCDIVTRAQASRVIGERSEPLSRVVFNDQPRGIYGRIRTYVRF